MLRSRSLRLTYDFVTPPPSSNRAVLEKLESCAIRKERFFLITPNYSCEHLGLGYSRFARRYLGNYDCSSFLRLLECFTSAGSLLGLLQDHCGLRNEVTPFGNLRITGCYAPPRSVSPLRRVLHRLLESRHPPFALMPTIPILTYTLLTREIVNHPL